MAEPADDKARITGEQDWEGWYTRKELAEVLNVTTVQIRHWEKAGRLHGVVNADSEKREVLYSPQEVDSLCTERGVQATPKRQELEAEKYRTLQLNVVSTLLNLVAKPRETIDALQFRIIERQEARIIQLEGERDRLVDEIKTIKRHDAETSILEASEASGNRIKEAAAGKVMNLISRLMGGGGDTESWASGLTLAQLKDLYEAKEELGLSVEQVKKLQGSIIDATLVMQKAEAMTGAKKEAESGN